MPGTVCCFDLPAGDSGLVGTDLSGGPVSGDLIRKTGAVDLAGQILLEGDAVLGVVIVRRVVVVRGQSIRIGEGLDGSAQRIGDGQGDVGEGGNKSAGVDQELLTGFIEDQPVQEGLGGRCTRMRGRRLG